MGVLLIKCPVTGGSFPPAFQISANDAPTLPDALSQARCPHLQEKSQVAPKRGAPR
jgi:hypothetical protein